MLGDTLRLLRLEKRMTTEELADTIDVSPETIDYYENNVWLPGGTMSAKLANALGVSVPELLNGRSILYDEEGKMFIVQHMGGNQIKVIGTVRKDVKAAYLEKDE